MTIFVITGAASGVGRALALKTAHVGVSLGLVDIAVKELEEVAVLCREKGATVLSDNVDIRQYDDIENFISRVVITFGGLDYVFANAGVIAEFSEIEFAGLDIQVIRNIMDTNYYGSLNTLLPAVSYMVEAKHGHLIAITSISSLAATHNSGSYSASKAALSMWTDSLRLKLARHNISVTNVILGFVDTPMIATFSHAQLFPITSDLAAAHIMRAVYKKKKIVSIPRLRNIPWLVLRFTPITIRHYILDLIWKRIHYFEHKHAG